MNTLDMQAWLEHVGSGLPIPITYCETPMIDLSDLVMRMLTERFGSGPDNLEVLTTGQSGSEVFAATFAEPQPWSVVVKVNHDPKTLAGLERNLLVLTHLGLPVPAVLDSDLNTRLLSWCLNAFSVRIRVTNLPA